jgi:hypothetical protein
MPKFQCVFLYVFYRNKTFLLTSFHKILKIALHKPSTKHLKSHASHSHVYLWVLECVNPSPIVNPHHLITRWGMPPTKHKSPRNFLVTISKKDWTIFVHTKYLIIGWVLNDHWCLKSNFCVNKSSIWSERRISWIYYPETWEIFVQGHILNTTQDNAPIMDLM